MSCQNPSLNCSFIQTEANDTPLWSLCLYSMFAQLYDLLPLGRMAHPDFAEQQILQNVGNAELVDEFLIRYSFGTSTYGQISGIVDGIHDRILISLLELSSSKKYLRSAAQ